MRSDEGPGGGAGGRSFTLGIQQDSTQLCKLLPQFPPPWGMDGRISPRGDS